MTSGIHIAAVEPFMGLRDIAGRIAGILLVGP